MAGIYIHIPFCKQRCTYCDFHFSTNITAYKQKMIESICLEMVERKNELNNEEIETIYFGGGTPSVLDSSEISKILKTVYDNYPVKNNAEITLETNPDDFDIVQTQSWFEAGINRLSIGIQSFRDEDLIWMNRAHNSKEAKECIEIAKNCGFDNISVDLIYGLPNLSLGQWEHQLETVLQFDIQHISAYCLTVEQKTLLAKWVAENKIILPEEDQQSDQFEMLIKKLSQNEIHQYEISNFSKLNFESKHNSSYWQGKSYLGFGPSAHSFNGKIRRWNVASNQNYMKALELNEKYFDEEVLTDKNIFNEKIMLGLRTVKGLNINHLSSSSSSSSFGITQIKIEELINQNLAVLTNNNLILTPKGRLQADAIASSFFQLD